MKFRRKNRFKIQTLLINKPAIVSEIFVNIHNVILFILSNVIAQELSKVGLHMIGYQTGKIIWKFTLFCQLNENFKIIFSLLLGYRVKLIVGKYLYIQMCLLHLVSESAWLYTDAWLLERALLVYSDDTTWKCENQQKIWLSLEPGDCKRP